MTPEDVSRTHWWHILVIVVPNTIIVKDTAILWITDGENKDDFLPDLDVEGQFDYNLLVAADMATASGMVVANLYQIPNTVKYNSNKIGSEKKSENNKNSKISVQLI